MEPLTMPNPFPFPLELLERAGFVGNELQANQNVIIWVDDLHQLQNLYFALTGKELELKP